uniref:NF-kappa-B essential modulator NEMO CC2-LZ domain-containing protein n=1 Tax=Photinus pyralis TaxID=7054 RepID=A0A1Y1L1Y4_PHOPY
MAVSSMLPPDCSLYPESDDEESFVVLGHSLPPESIVEVKNDTPDLLDSSVVQQSISLASSALESSLPSSPSLPQLDKELILRVTKQNVSAMTSANVSVDLSPDEIQQKVDLLIEENLKLKETLHQNNLAMKKQYGILATWQNEVSMVHASHKQKFDDIKKYVEKLKLENAKLSALVTTTEKEKEELRNEIKHLKSEQELATEKDKVDLNVLKSSFDNLCEFELLSTKKKIKELEQQLLAEKSNQKDLQSSSVKVQNLTDDLQRLRLTSEKDVNNLNRQLKESQALQKILLDEIKALKAQLLTTSTTKENHVNFEEQLMAAQMHITQLELLRNEDRETINANEEKILQLENQVKEMAASKETLDLLHEQLDIYKTDFEAEHHAKLNLGREKETIAEDLRNLQRRNQQLLEEVDRLRGSDYVHVVREEHAAAPPTPQRPKFRCPNCNRSYINRDEYYRHVAPCMADIDVPF